MPSIKLFKRMTTLKKEKNDLEREYQYLKDKNEDLYFLNEKLNEALKSVNEKN
jgi:FtsZ-binding cell division protein ZapB